MKYLYIIALSMFTSTVSFAQWDGQSIDKDAKKILDKLKAQYDTYQSMEVDFTLVFTLPEEDDEVQKGKVGQKGEKYFLQTEDREIYSDGTAIWLYLKSNNEVQLNDADMDEDEGDMLSPKDMMRIYESDDFVYAITDTKKENGVSYTHIEFKPSDRDSEYSKMRLIVDTKANKMKSLKVFSKDGSRYTLTIDKLKPNVSFADADFVFDPNDYPGIHVEDLRID